MMVSSMSSITGWLDVSAATIRGDVPVSGVWVASRVKNLEATASS